MLPRLAFYYVSPTRLIKSIKPEHSCKIFYLYNVMLYSFCCTRPMQVRRFKISFFFTGKSNYTAADIMQIILAKEEDASNVADSVSATPSIQKHSTTSTGRFINETSLYSFYIDHIYSYCLYHTHWHNAYGNCPFCTLRGLPVRISMNWCVSFPKDSVILANSADPALI